MGARCSKLGFCWWLSNLKSNVPYSSDVEKCGENERMKLPAFKECSLDELKVATSGFSVENFFIRTWRESSQCCLQLAA
ncbi:unnamed protein product [Coffea canephora]|uniref:DH200=94 genomic scaffold, scaffold_4372 n=1 Tax=Coffea canephora TaxID=49390 RepID=A0A068VLI7_COFCA|nr:unnamed protein product [Coffea canephora]